MSERVYIFGVGMTRFGKYLDRSIKQLTGEALERVLADCGLERDDIQAAWFANSYWGMYTMQHGIRGQVALQPGQVDLLIFNASLHYAVDLKKCLRSAAELLRPGGAMIIMDTPVLVGDFTALQPAEGQPLRRGRQLPLAELKQALTTAGLTFEIRQPKRGWRWSIRQWRIRFFGGPGFTLPFIIARH